jgi:hypothetical protein
MTASGDLRANRYDRCTSSVVVKGERGFIHEHVRVWMGSERLVPQNIGKEVWILTEFIW